MFRFQEKLKQSVMNLIKKQFLKLSPITCYSNSAVEVSSAALAKQKVFIENYHWHTGDPLKDEYETTIEDRIGKTKVSLRHNFPLNPLTPIFTPPPLGKNV